LFPTIPSTVEEEEDNNNVNKLGTSKNIEITAKGVVIKCIAILTEFL
jgi:hypothetical protein